MMDKLKKYFWIAAVLIPFIILTANHLYAMWQTPEKVKENRQYFDDYIEQQNDFIVEQKSYTAAQEVRNEQQQEYNRLLLELVSTAR